MQFTYQVKRQVMLLSLMSIAATAALSQVNEESAVAESVSSVKSEERAPESKASKAKALFESLQKDQKAIAAQITQGTEKKKERIKKACLRRPFRLPLGAIESLASRLRVNPNQIRLQSTTYRPWGACEGKLYTPRGVCVIYIHFRNSSEYPTGFKDYGCR